MEDMEEVEACGGVGDVNNRLKRGPFDGMLLCECECECGEFSILIFLV